MINPYRIVSLPALLGIAGAFLLCGCANYQIHLAEPTTVSPLPNKDSLSYTLYLVGDLGYAPQAGLHTLEQLTRLAQTSDKQADLLLLGDLTDPGGLPRKKETEDRKEAEQQLERLTQSLESFSGKIYVAPGDRELGPKASVRNLQRFENYLKDTELDLEFVPDDGCGGPDDEELTDDISLVGINTAWYLSNWNKDPDINADCDIRDRGTFMLAFGDEVRGLRDKTVIVAMHHPLRSSGNKDGYFTLEQHLFPLRDLSPGLYVPLPVVGSLFRFIQKVAGGRQSLSGIRYKEMVRGLTAQIEDTEHIIFVSGHERIMQYTKEDDEYYQIIAGSGSKPGPSGKAAETPFSYGHRGFSRLEFYEKGSVYVAFYTVSEEQATPQLVFRQKIQDNRFLPPEPDLPPVPPLETNDTSVLATVYGTEAPKRSKLFLQLFGKHYRPLYYEPVRAPIVQLDTLFGGLSPYRRGGGMTTQSLHLADSRDRRYQMRSVRKNPVQLLPYPLESSFAAEVVREQFTAIHPYGALAVAPMEEALGLYGARPMLAYVPKQDRLSDFNSGYGNELYLIEARPDEDWRELDYFGNSKEIIGNDNVREEITSDWKKRADQRQYLRARLLDAILGDWDRHRDQWRWATIEQEDKHVLYKPIARDRDQVFSNFDGTLLAIIRRAVPAARKLKPFDEELDDPYWRGSNGKWNDRFFLTELTWEDWRAEASFITEHLTDSLIDASLRQLPAATQKPSLETYQIDRKLRARRDQLLEYSRAFYETLAKEVNVIATNDDDYFVAERASDGQLTIRLYDRSDKGDADELYYSRTFLPKETKEVRLYGLGGEDYFQLSGSGRSPIRVRIIGGPDKDEVGGTEGRGPTIVYDGIEGMKVNNRTPGTRLRLTPIRNFNQYNFLEFQQDYVVPTPVFGFNPDDGLFIGSGFRWRKHGFKHDSHAQSHQLKGGISVTNWAIQMAYDGEFNDLFGYRRDFAMRADFRSRQYVVNFFGLGNDTEDDADDLDFNRVRQQRILAHPTVRFRFGERAQLRLGPIYEAVLIDSTTGRFIVSDDARVPDRVFDRQHFGGYEVNFSINTLAIPMLPDRGLHLEVFGGQQWNLEEGDRSFYRIGGSLSYYLFFGNRIVGIATRVGAEHVDGDFEFYQAARLGGRTNLRGVRSERFLGNTVFYHNTDLRFRLFGVGKGFIPTVGGLLFGFDYGRVWLEGEDSDTWHTSYGGGIWVAPFNIAIISAAFYTSPSDQRFILKAGFPF